MQTASLLLLGAQAIAVTLAAPSYSAENPQITYILNIAPSMIETFSPAAANSKIIGSLTWGAIKVLRCFRCILMEDLVLFVLPACKLCQKYPALVTNFVFTSHWVARIPILKIWLSCDILVIIMWLSARAWRKNITNGLVCVGRDLFELPLLPSHFLSTCTISCTKQYCNHSLLVFNCFQAINMLGEFWDLQMQSSWIV